MTAARVVMVLVDVILLKASIVIGIGAGTAWCLRHNASAASAVWKLIAASLVAVPLLRALLPQLAITDLAVSHHVVSWALPMIGVWGTGVVLLLVRWWRDLSAMRAVIDAAAPVIPLSMQRIVNRAHMIEQRVASSAAPIRPIRPEVRLSHQLSAPAVAGWRRPVILLPASADEWPAHDLRAALLHELSHIRRNDWATAFVERVMSILFWPNPLLYAMRRASSLQRELAADQRVLQAGFAPLNYARTLLRAASTAAPPSRALVAFSATDSLAYRIGVLADTNAIAPDRHRPTLQRLAPLWIAMTSVLAASALWICTP